MSSSRKTTSDNGLTAACALLVSRDPAAFRTMWMAGDLNMWKLETACCGSEALERVENGLEPDVVVLDIVAGDPDSLHTLRWLRRVRPALPVVLLSPPGEEQYLTDAARLGAEDCVLKPFQTQELERVLRRYVSPRAPETAPSTAASDIEVLGDDFFFVAASRAMRIVRARAEMLAQVNVPVVIAGECSSGKEATARLIHKLSIRSPFSFLKVNCAALPADLLSRELLGYELVSVRGAVETKQGKLELCHNGTLLLEDIDSMPESLQAKLLPVLQSGQFLRLGGETPVRTDVRILATVTLAREGDVSPKGQQEVSNRFSRFTLQVPPLRERAEDIPLLIGNFINRLARRYGLPARQVSPNVLHSCQRYNWPGNLRELENFVKRYLIMGDDSLGFEELQDRPTGKSEASAEIFEFQSDLPPANGMTSTPETTSLKSLVRNAKGEAEKNAITRALEETRWNRKAAARLLRISYRALLYKIQEYHMSPPDPTIVLFNHGTKLGRGREN